MFKMKGVVPPMITPFTKSGEVDYAGLRTLVTYLSNEVMGCSSLVPMVPGRL
jgi:dihydrodipicolinate synthase/N-acetylneuraminate lyase